MPVSNRENDKTICYLSKSIKCNKCIYLNCILFFGNNFKGRKKIREENIINLIIKDVCNK